MIRVFLVDDHPAMRSGLRTLLQDQPNLYVVGEAANGLELLAQLPDIPTDVVLLDISMPGMGGAETTRQLREQYPAVQVLVLTMQDHEEYVFQLLDAGAMGYILKSAGLDEIMHGIRTVAVGRPFLCSDIGFAMLHQVRAVLGQPPVAPHTKPSSLTRRETEVLQLIAEGLTNGEIAAKLFTSKRTVETHRQRIISKTKMRNTASLIRFAVSEGLIS